MRNAFSDFFLQGLFLAKLSLRSRACQIKTLRTWRVTKTFVSRKSWQAEVALVDRPRNRLRSKDQCGQATKGVWGMSWRQKAMKGVEGCDKLGEAVKQALIPGFPNDRAPNP